MRNIIHGRKFTLAIVGAFALGLAGAPVAGATTYSVNTTADTNAVNPAVGPQDSGGNISLRSAIEALNTIPGTNDRINVPAGTYTLTAGGGAGQGTAGELLVSDANGITIAGAGASSTTVDANYIDRAFELTQGTVATISGVTVRRGRSGPDLAGHTATSCPATAPAAANPGGGILDDGTLTLSNDTFTNNMSAGNGGAVEDQGGLTVTGSEFSANVACHTSSFSVLGFANGGGIDESSLKNWSVDSSTVSGNLAQGDGGGLSESGLSDPTLTVTDSTIVDNHSDHFGGGIVGEGTGIVSLFADTLTGNTATQNGGGIGGNDTDQVVNSTITNNFAGCKETDASKCTDSSGSGEGGGIEDAASPVTISFSTINDNTAEGGNGGNLANGDSASYTLDDSIVTGGVADGSPENCSGLGTPSSTGNNLFDDDGTGCGAIASDLKNANPKLGPLANNGGPTDTEALLVGSQALDAANDTKCDAETTDGSGKPVDQRHFRRPEGAHCDIGAFEASPDVGLTGSVDKNTILVGQQDTVTWVVSNAGPPGAQDTTFTDPGSANFRIDSVQTSKGTCSHTAKAVDCQLGLLAAGGHATIKLLITGLRKGKVVLNGTAKTSDTDSDPANNHASVSFSVNSKKPPPKPTADLAVHDTVSPHTVLLGKPFTYTLTAINNGPSTDTGVQVTDDLPKDVNIVSVTTGRGHCSHGTHGVSCALGTMTDSTAVKVKITVTGETTGKKTDAAKITGDVHDPHTGNNHASATAQVIARADLAITDSASPTRLEVGQKFTYTLVVTNRGPDTDGKVRLTDRLPQGVKFVGADLPGAGRCIDSGGTIKCSLGTMTKGFSRTVKVTVRAVTVGRKTDAAHVTGQVRDPNLKNNHAHASARVLAGPTVSIGPLGPACHKESSTITFTVTATASAGIRTIVVKVGGHVVRTYHPSGAAPQHKTLHISVQGSSLLVGRTYPVTASVTDTLGGSDHDRSHLRICRSAPKRGFTG